MNSTAAVTRLVIAVSVLLVGSVMVAVIKFGGGAGAGGTGPKALEPATSAVAPRPARPASDGAGQASRAGGRSAVEAAWVVRISRVTGIPAPAVRAYAAAQLQISADQPGCHLGWNTLAGIGWIESHHGTIGDRTLQVDGRSSTPILGPALDGVRFAAIRSSADSARWHGDKVWEHAVGPLQFLASTWERWGADGDADGVADPRDLDDAALAAGRYLCADAHDLATDVGWRAAVHSYNHDQAYAANVATAASTYAERTR